MRTMRTTTKPSGAVPGTGGPTLANPGSGLGPGTSPDAGTDHSMVDLHATDQPGTRPGTSTDDSPGPCAGVYSGAESRVRMPGHRRHLRGYRDTSGAFMYGVQPGCWHGR